MGLKNCRECQRPISASANPCPLCGKSNPHGTSAVLRYGGGLLLFCVGLGVCAALDDGNRSQFAQDAVQKYEIAKRNGSPMDACVAAAFVASVFLQLKDEASYAAWKATEEEDCALAGQPKQRH